MSTISRHFSPTALSSFTRGTPFGNTHASPQNIDKTTKELLEERDAVSRTLFRPHRMPVGIMLITLFRSSTSSLKKRRLSPAACFPGICGLQ